MRTVAGDGHPFTLIPGMTPKVVENTGPGVSRSLRITLPAGEVGGNLKAAFRNILLGEKHRPQLDRIMDFTNPVRVTIDVLDPTFANAEIDRAWSFAVTLPSGFVPADLKIDRKSVV